MAKSKKKILVASKDKAGVAYYRSTNPHIHLEKNYNDEFHVVINYNIDWSDEEYLKKFDIIHFHRDINVKNENYVPKIHEICKKNGSKLIMDIDDYWYLPKEHPSYYINKEMKNFSINIISNFSNVDAVTTTTSYFADKIKKYNKNVYVIPNAIDEQEKQFIPTNERQTERVRIGWAGGSSHLHDLLLSSKFYKNISDNLKDKVQFNLCGFDTRGIIRDRKTGKQRKIQPHESVWVDFEKIVTHNYNLVKDDTKYFEHLLKIENKYYKGEEDKPYRRHWTKPLKDYATHYNNFDISIAPLVDNEFNRCKSQLKVIEAGFFKLPIICSKVVPYGIDIKNGFNGFIVDDSKKPKEWAQYARKLIFSENLREDMGNALYETVKNRYEMKVVSKIRKDVYEEVTQK